MKNVIRLKQSDLTKIITKVIEEQSVVGAPNYGVSSSSYQPLPQKYECVSRDLSFAAEYVIKQNVHPTWVKYGLGILGRESDFGQVMGKYGQKAPLEYTMNKFVEIIPGFEGLLKWGAKKVFNKENWVPSMGIAQMTPDIAKKYGVNLEDLMTLNGSLYAAIRYLIDLKKELTPYYDPSQPSKIILNKQIVNNPSSSGDASLDAAIMAYNLGASKFKRKYCQTNNTEYLAPCDSPNGIHKPMPKDNPNLILKVNTNAVVKNYVPNFKTNTTSLSSKFQNIFRDVPQSQYISSLGYLKEVVGHARRFSCIK